MMPYPRFMGHGSAATNPHKITSNDRRRIQWLAALIAAAAILAFWRIMGGGFLIWDDAELIVRNPDLVSPDFGRLLHYWTDWHSRSSLYMPVTYVFWGIVSALAQTTDSGGGYAGLNPAVFHAASLLLHVASALLLFVLLLRLTRSTFPAFFGALLFAVHPVQVEAVAWAAEASTPLSTLFSIWAILEFSVFIDRRRGESPSIVPGGEWIESSRSDGAWLHYSLGTLALILALLSKPSAVVVPFLVGVIEIIFRRRRIREVIAPLAGWLALCVPIALIARIAQQTQFTVPLGERPMVAVDAVAFYLYKLALPFELLPIYGRTPDWLFAHHAALYATWIAPASVVAIALIFRRRAPWVAGCALLFLLGVSPVLGLHPFVFQRISTTADRYLALAMLGPAFLAACLVPSRPRRPTLIALSVLAVALMGLTFRQTYYWHDTSRLFSRVLEYHPESAAAQQLMGDAYNFQSHNAERRGDGAAAARDLELAAARFRIAATLPYDGGVGDYNAGECLMRLHRFAQAAECYEAALRDPYCLPGKLVVYRALGRCYQLLGQNEKAADCFRHVASVIGPGGAATGTSAASRLQNFAPPPPSN